MSEKIKLELTWIGKDKRPRLEPRILIEDKALSYRAEAPAPVQGDLLADERPPSFHDNLLIQGDNLLALKALESKYAGEVKCVFIDPPYNTGSAFTHYDDGLEHSLWLTMMRDRLEIIRNLLADEGSLWISIDDNECHYLKILCDEVFGRANFIATVIWEKTTSARNDARFFSADHDYVIVYAKEIKKLELNRVKRTESAEAAYTNPDNDPRGPWREGDYKCAKSADERPNLYYPIKHPKTGENVWPRKERVWAYGQPEYLKHVREDRLWWGKTGNYKLPKLKRFRSEAPSELVPRTLWQAEEVSQTRTARQEMKLLFADEPFSTPKPEKLMQKVISLATNPGDLVLDSFAGSGTTGAVAHKMGRRWIMVELGEHCHTHIVPRLRKVIDGEDKGGISKAVNWQGGGGFRYLRLAPSLLKKDQWGNWVINPAYNAEMLAEAMCKHMGFTYAPSQAHYWMHGYSSETDFIYVTTGSLSHDQLRLIGEEVGSERSLLICCKAFMADAEAFPNLTLKKIPRAILGKCEWDHDDYSFSIDLMAEDIGDEEPLEDE